MEENKQIPEMEEETATAPCEETSCEACDTQAPEEVTVEITPKEKPKREHKGAFFAVFGAVVGVCALLLFAVLFLGEGGFDIVRTLRSERTVFVRDGVPEDGMLTPSEAAYAVQKYTISISTITADGTGTGSGFVYDASGHIATNYHVIENAESVQVMLPDGTALDATVVGFDELSDLAVLQVERTDLTVATLGKSETLLVGEDVVAVGTPASLNYAGTATFGKITATSRILALGDSSEGSVSSKLTVIQTDASLNPGNSGGPLADMYGNVVGVVVRKIVTYGGVNYEGLSFALPIDGARTILDAIIRDGAFTGDNPLVEGPSQLGVTGYSVSAGKWYRLEANGNVSTSPVEKEGYHKASADGVYVSDVSGAQATDKLYAGDVILRVNGLHTRTIQDVIDAVNRHYAGTTVTVTVFRNGENKEIQVRLGEGAIA